LVDKWFWRTWLLFAVVTGFAMDYLTPIEHRSASFKEFMEEWILDQFESSLQRFGLEKPWYWPQFLEAVETYHHMVYVSAYTYRLTTWFDFAVPGPAERAWLARKYPNTWHQIDPVWERVTDRWRASGPRVEWYTLGTTPVGFCDLCQMILSGGNPANNSAQVVEYDGHKRIFCSEPCLRIFNAEPERYEKHRSVVHRILSGEAPANLLSLVRNYFDLAESERGKDVRAGAYPWLREDP
jgi:toluene monooxygenase system protein A